MTSNQNERKKKFLLVLPLLIVPFATLFFWALGGGTNANARQAASTGLNMKLPGAQLKNDSNENKLSFYSQAQKDSLKFRQERQDDPYYKRDSNPDATPNGVTGSTGGLNNGGFNYQGIESSQAKSLAGNEQAISERLAAINRQINQPTGNTLANMTRDDSPSKNDQLNAALAKLNSSAKEDPQMQQLSKMLEQIQEIQNPGLMQQKIKEQSEKNRGSVYAVSAISPASPVTTLRSSPRQFYQVRDEATGFYSLDTGNNEDESQNSIQAVVNQNQTVVNGATIKLRLVNDIYISGKLIPKDNFVFGTVALSGERLTVKITSIRCGRSIFPVVLNVYDMDGLEGIYIPGAITRDVAKESADQSLQSLGFTNYDPSIGAQAANAGIAAAKTLFSRKVRLVKVTVKAGYAVLLRDEKQKQDN